MSSSYIFFNTKVENSGILSWIGDLGLTPFRYLFRGKTIQVENSQSGEIVAIHRVSSFHPDGSVHQCKTSRQVVTSSSTGLIKTVLAVVMLIPGLLLALFKMCAYLSSSIRENHFALQKNLTPIILRIGDAENPIKDTRQLNNTLKQKWDSAKGPTGFFPVQAIVIHGDGTFRLIKSAFLTAYCPHALILKNVQLYESGSVNGELLSTNKWLLDSTKPDSLKTTTVSSEEEALSTVPPLRSWLPWARYHMIFEVVNSN